jgi:hypothetical protein
MTTSTTTTRRPDIPRDTCDRCGQPTRWVRSPDGAGLEFVCERHRTYPHGSAMWAPFEGADGVSPLDLVQVTPDAENVWSKLDYGARVHVLIAVAVQTPPGEPLVISLRSIDRTLGWRSPETDA